MSAAAIVILILALLVLAGAVGLGILWALVAMTAMWELDGLAGKIGWRAPSWLTFPLAGLILLVGVLWGRGPVNVALVAAMPLGLGVLLFVRPRVGPLAWLGTPAAALYVGVPLYFYLRLFGFPFQNRLSWVLVTLAAVAVSDAAAMLVGSQIGRHRLLVTISPNKTLEGALAGIVAPMLLLLALSVGPFRLALGHALGLGLLIGLAAEAGDLAESQLKRLAGVKDSSHLIPGHGGVLDRIDSALFSAMVVYAYAVAWHLLS